MVDAQLDKKILDGLYCQSMVGTNPTRPPLFRRAGFVSAPAAR